MVIAAPLESLLVLLCRVVTLDQILELVLAPPRPMDERQEQQNSDAEEPERLYKLKHFLNLLDVTGWLAGHPPHSLDAAVQF